MSKTIKEERLRWVMPIIKKEIKPKDLAKVCPYGKRTLERWVASCKKYGDKGLEPESTKLKSHPGETPIRIKERIIELRNENKNCYSYSISERGGWDEKNKSTRHNSRIRENKNSY